MENEYQIEQYVEGMSVLTDVYDKMCSYEDLEISYREARKGKRYRPEILKFSDKLETGLDLLLFELNEQVYEMGRYRMFYVHEPKLRLVMSIPFHDRIVQWSIYRYLFPFYDKQFIEDSYACRKDKGSHAAADKLQYWLRQAHRKELENPDKKCYYLKLDISKYFYRVNHEILLDILRVRIHDDKMMTLLERIINNPNQKFGLPAGFSPEDCPYEDWLDDTGMPIGNLTSQMFANIYLDQLDQFCKHTLGISHYIRYMDDVIILSESKEELHRWKDCIERFLNECLALSLNNKTAIRPITLGIDFVGYKIWATHRKLKKSTARKIIRKVKVICYQLSIGEMTKDEFKRRAASYHGILIHCNSHGLCTELNRIYCSYVKTLEQNGIGLSQVVVPEPKETKTEVQTVECHRNNRPPLRSCEDASRDHQQAGIVHSRDECGG